MKLKLLLHVCCGTCGAWVPRRLAHDYEVDLFYFNPNIHPREEYERRLKSVRETAHELDLKLIEGECDPRAWFEYILRSGATTVRLSNEPEGGKRCDLCFRHRLAETAHYASEHGYDAFATTLTVGRR
ncbi:MAG: epoxyqueuosine reductase QueH, partial [Candidatus Uhrbacteria bacterium]